MKKWIFGLIVILMAIWIPAFGEEIFKPQTSNTGIIGGQANEYWRQGNFGRLLLPERAAGDISGNPPANFGWLYVKDSAGTSTLYFENDAGSVTALGGAVTWDQVPDPTGNASITLSTYTNIFTGSATASNQNQFLNTGNMGDVAIVYIQQLTGTPTDGKLLYATTASTSVDGIQVYNSVADVTATNALLRLDYKDDGDTDGYFIFCRDNNSADTQFAVRMDGAVGVGASVTFNDAAGGNLIQAIAGQPITINVANGDASGEDLIVTAHNIQLTANGLMTFSPDGALAIAIDASDTDIATALNVGANDIVGTTGLINYTNFDVDGSGNVICVGLTASGAVNVGTFKQDNLIPATAAPATITLNGAGAGGVTIGGTSTGTITLGGGATLVNLPAATDMTLSGGTIGITDTGTGPTLSVTNNSITNSNLVTLSATALTSANLVSATAGNVVTGSIFYAQITDGAGFTGYYFRAYDGGADDFSVKRYGATVIAGNASGTEALTLTAGDLQITSGDIDVDAGMITVDTTGETKLSYIKMTTNTDVANDSALFTLWQTDSNAGNSHYLLRLEFTANGDAQDDFIVMEDNAGDDRIAFKAGGTTVWSLDPASYVQIDGTTQLTTTTAGVLDINMSTLTTGASAIDVKVINTGNAATVTGIKVDLDDDTAGTGTFYGLSVGSSDTAPAAGANLSTGIGLLTGLDVGIDADLDAAAKLFDIDCAATYTAKMIDINLAAWTGTSNEGVIDIVSTAAATVPAGQIIRIRQLGTGVHAAAIAGSLLYLEDDATQPGAGTSYAVYIDATNIEAMHIATGKVLIAETLTSTGGVSVGNAADSLIKIDTVELSNADIKALVAAPKALVAAPGADYFVEVISVVLILDYGTNVLTCGAGDDLVVQYNTTGIDITASIETTGFIDQAADTVKIITPSDAITTAATNAVNRAVELFNIGAEFAGNAGADTTMTVKISYRTHKAGL